MANYNKQFNFRNGVQVDNDNLVVSPTGLVGIGTTVPTQNLDVRGNISATGFSTSSSLFAQTVEIRDSVTTPNVTFTDFIVGSGVTIGSGIVTATGSGIITYYGDARYLLGMPTSQWKDMDVGLGFTSIYNEGNVGVGTTDPRFRFQISGTNDTTIVGFTSGVGFTDNGNILATGIATAHKFVGIGSDLTFLDADNITSGTVTNDRLPVLENSKIPNNLVLSGIVTATRFDGSILGNVVGDVTGTASTALSLSGTPNVVVGILTATAVAASSFIGGITGDVTGNLTGTATTATALTDDAEVDIADMTVGVTTVSSFIGLGTDYLTGRMAIGGNTNAGGNDIFINRAFDRSNSGLTTTIVGNARIQLWSDLGESTVTIGTSETPNLRGNGQIRYGNRSSGFPYSTSDSLDFLNYGDGNINYYLQAGNAGIDTGAFHWHNKDSRMLSLTYEGNLGVGVTNPSHRLHVNGISTFTDSVHMNSTLEVEGNLTIGGSLSFGSVSTLNVDLGGNLTSADGNEVVVRIPADGDDPVETAEFKGRLVGGASTITKLDISGNGQSSPFLKVLSNANADAVASDVVIDVNNEAQNKFVVNEQGGVGIGTTNPQNSLDMEYAQRPVVFPNITTLIRDNLAASGVSTTPGSAIYNTDTNKLQVYDGTTWNDCF